jgi:hypothetical protein
MESKTTEATDLIDDSMNTDDQHVLIKSQNLQGTEAVMVDDDSPPITLTEADDSPPITLTEADDSPPITLTEADDSPPIAETEAVMVDDESQHSPKTGSPIEQENMQANCLKTPSKAKGPKSEYTFDMPSFIRRGRVVAPKGLLLEKEPVTIQSKEN